MLALLGVLTIALFLYLIMTKKVSVIVALVIVPVLFAVIGGFWDQLGEATLNGVIQVAPTGIMLMFAVLYFGLMSDAGLFDPIIKKVVSAVKGDPLKIIVGTAAVTMLVHLDGDGTATFMITITAFLPIYKRIGINKLILPCVVALGAGAMHLVLVGDAGAGHVRAANRCQPDVHRDSSVHGRRDYLRAGGRFFPGLKGAQAAGRH